MWTLGRDERIPSFGGLFIIVFRNERTIAIVHIEAILLYYPSKCNENKSNHFQTSKQVIKIFCISGWLAIGSIKYIPNYRLEYIAL